VPLATMQLRVSFLVVQTGYIGNTAVREHG
jgi:hypothetical protein